MKITKFLSILACSFTFLTPAFAEYLFFEEEDYTISGKQLKEIIKLSNETKGPGDPRFDRRIFSSNTKSFMIGVEIRNLINYEDISDDESFTAQWVSNGENPKHHYLFGKWNITGYNGQMNNGTQFTVVLDPDY